MLSPYTAQCRILQARVASRVDHETGLLNGFASPKGDGVFVQTIDSFQGGEADLVVVSTVRNNQKMGRHALGILGDRRRMNVLLSRAKHKLVLVTSTGFLKNAVKWSEPGRGSGHDLEFLGALMRRIDLMVAPDDPDMTPTASIIACGEDGKVVQ
ncbi:C-terminal helicase domain-containing protein [Pseudooceanicola batsensis]|uniref:C-terminal helicase domain-containing protein n=1 Tax=Pseudooceanicola batsensis TaxID=314255 RepID=UPI000A053436|nr:C-terminal helicase domain-containing protein [Pseudooceanicola batsensis]